MYLGIDPGFKSLGLCLLEEYDNKLVPVISESLIPSDLGGITQTVDKISSLLADKPIVNLTIERYVAYEGKHNAASEQILMLIGALVYFFESRGIPVIQVRAIEWKPELCKFLVRNKGFDNPSTKFDKKFSIAAAKCIAGKSPKDDHEADAICLASIGKIRSNKIV